MHSMALPNLTQTIPHQKLVIPRREQRGRHIDENCNPAVIHIAESFAPEEDSCHDPCSKVTSEVCGDRNISESPDHRSVCKTNGEWSAGGRDEGVCGVKTGPDYDSDVGVDEEFGQEKVAKVSGRGSMLVELFSAQELGRNGRNSNGNPRTFDWDLGTCTERLPVLR